MTCMMNRRKQKRATDTADKPSDQKRTDVLTFCLWRIYLLDIWFAACNRSAPCIVHLLAHWNTNTPTSTHVPVPARKLSWKKWFDLRRPPLPELHQSSPRLLQLCRGDRYPWRRLIWRTMRGAGWRTKQLKTIPVYHDMCTLSARLYIMHAWLVAKLSAHRATTKRDKRVVSCCAY